MAAKNRKYTEQHRRRWRGCKLISRKYKQHSGIFRLIFQSGFKNKSCSVRDGVQVDQPHYNPDLQTCASGTFPPHYYHNLILN